MIFLRATLEVVVGSDSPERRSQFRVLDQIIKSKL